MANTVLLILASCGLAFISVNGSGLQTCVRDYMKIGCFEEYIREDMLVNERHKVQWKNIVAYMHHFACVCSAATKKANEKRSGPNIYVGFALHYWGECYGKTQAQIDILKESKKAGKKQTHQCTGDQSYTGCKDEHQECVGHNFAEYVYELRRTSSAEIKIDGGYSDWFPWSPCEGKCGMGKQFRERTCMNPEPKGSGKDCSSLGETTDSRSCDTGKKCPVNGGFSKWSTSGVCSKTCGGGTKTETRKCNNPAPANGGKECVGPLSVTRSCKNDLCPVDGGFSKWSAFGACSKTCGGGTKTKIRKCNNPAPANGGKNCVGALSVTRPCKNNLCPVDGGFSKWSTFGACSKTCGGGAKTKTRKCNNPAPANGGKDCVGPLTVTRPCKNDLCPGIPVDGGFSKWSAFGACSKTCGGGTKTKIRKCNNPAPANGGKDCVGALTVTRPCKNDLCLGSDGISKAQDLVRDFVLAFHKLTYPKKDPSGKFHQAVFAIQRAVANEFAFGTMSKTLQKRLDDLKKFLKIATKGGSIDFARATLGRSLFVFMKKKIKDGLPIDQLQAASNDYLTGIKKEVGEKKFGELMLELGGASLMFAVDTTGSMRDEIRAARGIANTIINMDREFPVDYILSPFNDPNVGPVTYKDESNKHEFISEIKKLQIKGGGDCLEMAFGGMIGAFTANPKLGSPMFVFTDAGAKDDTFQNKEALKTLADQYGSTINFFTTPRGCGRRKGIKSYQELAAYTSGQILPLDSHSEISKFTSYVKNSLKSGTTIAKGTVRTKRRPIAANEAKFYVDSEIKSLMVTVNSGTKYKVRYVKLGDGNGRYYSPQSRTVYTAMYNINDPVPGQWKLSFGRRSGKHTFIVKAFSEKAVDFSPYFLHQEKKGWPVLSVSNPLSGGKSSLVLQVSGIDLVNLDSLKAAITRENSRVIQGNIALKNIGGTAGIFQASINTPSGKFKVVLSGTTKKGSKFTRLSQASFKAHSAVITPISAGNEYTVSASKGSAKIEVYLYNKGSAQKYRMSGASTIGTFKIGSWKADASQISLGSGANKTVRFTFNPPSNANSMIGKTFTVAITAAVAQSGKKVQKNTKGKKLAQSGKKLAQSGKKVQKTTKGKKVAQAGKKVQITFSMLFVP